MGMDQDTELRILVVLTKKVADIFKFMAVLVSPKISLPHGHRVGSNRPIFGVVEPHPIPKLFVELGTELQSGLSFFGCGIVNVYVVGIPLLQDVPETGTGMILVILVAGCVPAARHLFVVRGENFPTPSSGG